MQDPNFLTAMQISNVRELLGQLPAQCRMAEVTDVQIAGAAAELCAAADSEWKQLSDEVVQPRREGVLGMILVRKRRQLAHSVKLSNLGRDPFQSIPAVLTSFAAASAIPGLVAAPPVTFPSFLLGVALAWVRTFAHPIGYGEAALLHYMNQVQAIKGKVSEDDLRDAGSALVQWYGYVKGQNSNEVLTLLTSLKGWKAIEEFDGGYRVLETVPFGFGPIEYAS